MYFLVSCIYRLMKERSQCSDGSQYYGNGVWGPSTADLQRANLSFTNRRPKIEKEPNSHLLFISQESVVGKLLQIMSKIKLPAKFVIPGSMAAMLIMSACSRGSGGEKNNTQELENKASSGYSLPFPKGETWYLTTGPHGDGHSNGVKYAIDIAPPEGGFCPEDGRKFTIDNRIVTASASGEVIAKGDDKNRNDPYHSEIRIKDESGLTQVYIHLDNTKKVKVGNKVKQGDPLGNPSCEFPPGGNNTGPHVHIGLMKDGQAIPIDGVEIGEWTIHNGVDGKDGTMTKPGEKTRTANVGRYGENSNGIRNDLPNNPNKAVVAVPKSPIPPISGSIKEKPVSPTLKPTETLKPVVENKVSISKKPEDLFRLLLTTAITPDELPTGMTARGNSVGNLDATMQTLKAVGQTNIVIEDSLSTPAKGMPNGGIGYNIFPDSSNAKAAYNLIIAQGSSSRTFDYLNYPVTVSVIPTMFGQQITLVTALVDNIAVTAALINSNQITAETRSIELAKAAIGHLGRVGK